MHTVPNIVSIPSIFARYVLITEGTPWRIFFVCKKEKRDDSLFQEIIAALTSHLQL